MLEKSPETPQYLHKSLIFKLGAGNENRTLRGNLETLTKDLKMGREATEEEMDRIYEIIMGPIIFFDPTEKMAMPGLGSFIKNELGSYIIAVVSAEHEYQKYPELYRKLFDDPEKLLRLARRSRKKIGTPGGGKSGTSDQPQQTPGTPN